jgi:leukotriene-A4 hydrolase
MFRRGISTSTSTNTNIALFRSLHITVHSPSFDQLNGPSSPAPPAHQHQRRRFSATGYRNMAAARDPNTLSNYDKWKTKHTTVNFRVNFDEQRLEGSVQLDLESLTDKESQEIILDTNELHVSSVTLDSSDSAWKLKDRVEPYGSPLYVSVPGGVTKGESVKLDIAVETTAKCAGLQWMTPAQTGNKKHPYVYSQCQAILARSVLPCQDTPDVKSTFTFNITSPLPVVASGVPVSSDASADGGKLFKFEQKVPIPSYLFALASGDLETARIGKNSVVATGPEAIKEAQWELEGDMDKFLDIAQKLVFDYQWGEYNVLVLPPSFAYGGKTPKTLSRASDVLMSM